MTIHISDGKKIIPGAVLVDPTISLTGGATGDLFYRDATGAFTRLVKGTTNYLLRAGATIPEYVHSNNIINLGSDADGDIYYRNGGVLVRLPKGFNGEYLCLAAGIPAWAAVSSDSATGYAALRGGVTSRKDDDEIYITANTMYVKDKFLNWDTLTFDVGSPAASTMFYVYVDYSECTSGVAVTAAEIIYSTTAPAYDTTYKCLMNGDDRFIGVFLTDGSSNVLPYTWDRNTGFYRWDDPIIVLSAQSATTMTDVTDMVNAVPNLGEMEVRILAYHNGGSEDNRFYLRKNGSSAAYQTARGGSALVTGAHMWIPGIRVITDTSQLIEYSVQNALLELSLYVQGIFINI